MRHSFGAKINYDREVDAKLSMLRILYLPELDEEHVEFSYPPCLSS